MKTRNTLVLVLALCASLLAGCGASAPINPPVEAPEPRLIAVSTTVEVLQKTGALSYRSVSLGPEWHPHRPGEPLFEPTHLSAAAGDVLLGFGSPDVPDAKLWLKDGAKVMLSQSSDGTIAIELLRGRARLSAFEDAFRVSVAGFGDATGRDLLLSRAAGAEVTAAVDTARFLDEAGWTVAMGEPIPAGVGTLEAAGADAGARIDLEQLHVRAMPAGDAIEVHTEHIFRSHADEQLEGTFRFPLPDGAVLTGLAMEINGRMMEGELVERSKARETYEAIVDSMRDPALLEWEQGHMFKLRVFPIEPQGQKRIVLRYLVPANKGRFIYQTAAPGTQTRISHFTLQLAGKSIVDQTDFAPGQDIVVPVTTAATFAEERGEFRYVSARISPDWAAFAKGGTRPSRVPHDVVLLLDSSRSALESWDLRVQAIRAVLDELRPSDRFALAYGDVGVTTHTRGFVPATAAAIDAVVEALNRVEADGASDLAALLTRGGELVGQAGLRPVQVVYVGDGVPTWGETAAAALVSHAAAALGEATPLHAMLLGRGADSAVMRRLAGASGGLVVAPSAASQTRRFALRLAYASGAPRFVVTDIEGPDGAVIYPGHAVTLMLGDSLPILARLPKDAPATVTLIGHYAGETLRRVVDFGTAGSAPHVARRWAALEIAQLQSSGAEKEVLVALSKEHGVMSKHTAFLVLESEEAYKRWKIERRRAEQAEAQETPPEVTGGDLENVSGDQASLHPDHIQPGDPEIRVPAPADARSVVVVFPFGETKVAGYEAALSAWTVRFLIDKETPDGTYQVMVRITHRDGRVETLPLSYTVDTKAPTVTVSLEKAADGSYLISAQQVVEDIGQGVRLAKDCARVEVRTPEGRVIRLRRKERGSFQGTWVPRSPVSGPFKFVVVAVDVPGNRTVFETTLEAK